MGTDMNTIFTIIIIFQFLFNLYFIINILKIRKKIRNGKSKMYTIDANFSKVTKLMRWLMNKNLN